MALEPVRIVALWDGTVDLGRARVVRGAEVTPLTTRESALFGYLAARPGQTVTREQLQIEVWGYSASVVSRTVDTTVRRLRTKIEIDPAHPAHVLTVHGEGYRFRPAGAGDDAHEPGAAQEQARVEAAALLYLGGLAAERGDLVGGLHRVRDAVLAARRAGDARLVAHASHSVGHLLHRLGELGEAAFVEAVGLLREADPALAASAGYDGPTARE